MMNLAMKPRCAAATVSRSLIAAAALLALAGCGEGSPACEVPTHEEDWQPMAPGTLTLTHSDPGECSVIDSERSIRLKFDYSVQDPELEAEDLAPGSLQLSVTAVYLAEGGAGGWWGDPPAQRLARRAAPLDLGDRFEQTGIEYVISQDFVLKLLASLDGRIEPRMLPGTISFHGELRWLLSCAPAPCSLLEANILGGQDRIRSEPWAYQVR